MIKTRQAAVVAAAIAFESVLAGNGSIRLVHVVEKAFQSA
jgi:hypothetical protein